MTIQEPLAITAWLLAALAMPPCAMWTEEGGAARERNAVTIRLRADCPPIAGHAFSRPKAIPAVPAWYPHVLGMASVVVRAEPWVNAKSCPPRVTCIWLPCAAGSRV